MISMYTKQEIIIRSHKLGMSQRTIAKELQINRKTVKKYLQEYSLQMQTARSLDQAQAEYLSSNPKYKTPERIKLRLTQDIAQEIDKLIEQNRLKLLQGLHKQLLKKCDIHEILQSKGYTIGYTTVCNYVRHKERGKTNKEAYIRQVYEPGSECEFDWGEIKLWLSGHLTKLYIAVYTSAYSNYRYLQIYQRQDTLSFMESHVDFFSHIGGVYHKMVYDNMRLVIARFVGKHEKEPTIALLGLKSHYLFQHRFCNAYRGNEKGHVERSVEYVRRKAFGNKSEFKDIEEATEHLQQCVNKLNNTRQQLTGKTACEMMEEEKQVLWSLPSPLSCSEVMELRVDKYSTVSYQGNRYSVPDKLVGEFVTANIFSNKIELYYNNQLVSLHKRNYGLHQWIISIEHYLSTFKKKPGALIGSAALACSDYLKNLYKSYFEGEPRDFIEFLHYCNKYRVTNESLEEAVKKLLNNNLGEINTEKLIALLGNKSYPKPDAIVLNVDETIIRSKEQLKQVTQLFNQH